LLLLGLSEVMIGAPVVIGNGLRADSGARANTLPLAPPFAPPTPLPTVTPTLPGTAPLACK